MIERQSQEPIDSLRKAGPQRLAAGAQRGGARSPTEEGSVHDLVEAVPEPARGVAERLLDGASREGPDRSGEESISLVNPRQRRAMPSASGNPQLRPNRAVAVEVEQVSGGEACD